MPKINKSWWIWSAWVVRNSHRELIYGCMVPLNNLPIDLDEARQLDLGDGSMMIISQRIVGDDTADLIRKNLEGGVVDLSGIFDKSDGPLNVLARRETIGEILGHSAAVITSFCTLRNWRNLNPDVGVWSDIFQVLEQDLGFPFKSDYAAHIGNFEILRLQAWGEEVAPFGIEPVDHPEQIEGDRSVRAFQIFRSAEFAEVAHIAQIVGHSCKERVLDRLISLSVGQLRSATIECAEVVDAYEFSMFEAASGRLLHREAFPFLTQIGMNMSVAGGTVQLDDRLSRKAKAAGKETAQSASNIQSHSTMRSLIDHKASRAFRQYKSDMHELAEVCFPQKGEDRWFPRTLDNEIGVIAYINSLLDAGQIKSAILVDPFFGIAALERLLLRLQSADVMLTIVTSLAKINPDTGLRYTEINDPVKQLEKALTHIKPYINPTTRIINLVRGNDQAFHDRYLVLYPHEGPVKIFLLSNSVNNMAANWPFCMSRLSDEVAYEALAYIEGLSRGEDTTSDTALVISFEWPPVS